jgi:hypothetical protein
VSEHDIGTLFLGLLCVVGAILAIWIVSGKRRDAAARRREHPHDYEYPNKQRRIDL